MSYGTSCPVYHDKIQSPLYGQGLLILWGKVDTKAVAEDELNEWWTNEHLPERLQLPGFIRARRYCSATQDDGNKTYLACYEVSTIGDLESEAYLHALNNPTLGTIRFMPYLAKMNRSACSVVWSQAKSANKAFARGLIGNCVASIVFYYRALPGTTEEGFVRQVTDTFSHRALHDPAVLNFHVAIHNEATTQAGSASKSYNDVSFDQTTVSIDQERKKYIALIEFAVPTSSASPAVEKVARECLRQINLFGGDDATWESYQLVCSMDLNAIKAAEL